MVKAEVSKLLVIFAATYPRFDVNDVKLQLWFEMLQDIPYELALVAVKKLICERNFPPTISDIRATVGNLLNPHSDEEDTGTAWGEVMKSVRNYGIYRPEEAISSMSRKTARIVRQLGWQEICLCENLGVIRGQFIKLYDALEEREKKNRMLPVELRKEISGK